MSSTSRTRLRRLLGIAIGLALFGGAVWVLHRELGEQTLADVIAEVRALPPRSVALALLATAAGYAALIGYDVLSLRALGQHRALRRAALAAFEGFAFANSLPFAFVVGGAVRFRFCTGWGLSAADASAVALFNITTYMLGLLAAAGIAFTLRPSTVPALLHLPVHSTRPIGIIALGCLAAHLAWRASGGPGRALSRPGLHPPTLTVAIAQIGISLLDWMLSGAARYALLPDPLGFLDFFGVFLLGQLAALVAQLPGGLGVFEAVVVGTLTPTVQPAVALSALLAYRVIYFLLPLALAAAVLGLREFRRLATAALSAR